MTSLEELESRIIELEKLSGYTYTKNEMKCETCHNNQFRVRITFDNKIKVLCKCGKVKDIN